MKKHGFLKTFIDVCSGTAIFPELAGFSLFKAVGHLILLALACTALNVAMRYHPFNLEYENICLELQNKFGGLTYTSKGILPERDPEKKASLLIDDLEVDYFPSLEEMKDFKPNDESTFGVLWTPRSIVLWINADGNPVPLLPLLVPTVVDKKSVDKEVAFYWNWMRNSSPSASTLREFAKLYQIPPTQKLENDSNLFRDFKSNLLSARSGVPGAHSALFSIPVRIPTLYVLYLAFGMLINILLVSPLYVLVFTMFSASLGKSEILGLKFSELLVIGLYTGYPGTVIATLYTALELPNLDFQSIFLIAYLVYSFPVFNRLRSERLTAKSGGRGENG